MNKIALVTGGSRGLGKSMALHLAENGNDVIITYNTKKELANEVVKEIELKGQKAISLQLDVSETGKSIPNFIATFKAALQSTFGKETFDYLINNAGAGNYQPIAEAQPADLDYLYNIHFKAPYLLAQGLVNSINPNGSIINVSSGYSRFSDAGFAAYGAMKAAIDTLTRFQAVEFAPLKIRVNAIAPGAVETDFAGGLVRDNSFVNEMVAGKTALGRTGQPNDIGKVIAFLASDASGWINGERLEVSGGIAL